MFYGWHVVGGAALIAVWSWGLGFYGLSIYLVSLRAAHPWSTGAVSMAITAFYLIGAVLTAFAGHAMRRFGPRVTVAACSLAMAAGVGSLPLVAELWQLYLAFAVLAVGWAGMSGAAINILLAPWFEARRGLAISLALTGASLGGVVVAPALLALIGSLGFVAGVWIVVAGMLATVLPVAFAVLGDTPARRGLHPDGAAAPPRSPGRPAGAPGGAGPGRALRTARYWTISLPFALGLAAQVGFVTHLVAYLEPLLGARQAGLALGATTLSALLGRVLMGAVADRIDRRIFSCGNFLLEALGFALLMVPGSSATLYAGCILFGLGVGNMITLPGLLVQREFSREEFAGVISLITATNQFTFAFGPGLMGLLRDYTGGYGAALAMGVGLEVVAAGIILLGRRGHGARVRDARHEWPAPGSARDEGPPAPPDSSAALTGGTMLQLRPNCECCDRNLPPESGDAFICSFECTFCRGCAENILAGRCPNCSGELVRRPVRPAPALARHPASTERVVRRTPCGQAA
jgi:predicted MFS family arabinose efflux permease